MKNSIFTSKLNNDIIEEEKLINFNFESIITIEEILTYFFNKDIKLKKNNFLNYYKIINYYFINNISNELINQKSCFSKPIEKLFHLQFISILIKGLFLFDLENDNKELLNLIETCLLENHQNFLIFSQFLMIELQRKNLTNIFSNKIQKTILEKLKIKNIFNLDINDLFLMIEKNNKEIEKQIKIIESKKIIFKTNKELKFSKILDLDKLSLNEVFIYCLKILQISEKEINIQNEEDARYIYKSVKVPFLPPIEKKENYILTIILDLDETLLYFAKNENNEEEEDEEYEENEENHEEERILLRPGLFEFLDNLIQLKCELIVFTSSNKNYADRLIDEIEKKKKYFKKRLYRENCVLMGSAYVKDISKLGRDLSKIAIIDNDLACFYLQQENGILIKPFTGINIGENDEILKNLYKILLNIINKTFKDIRIELEQYKEEIKNKVSN